jgi:hypothetical protein
VDYIAPFIWVRFNDIFTPGRRLFDPAETAEIYRRNKSLCEIDFFKNVIRKEK